MCEESDDENLFLNSPHTKKELEHGESFAFCGIQGWRKSNEDFHKHLIPINQQSWKLWSYFSIFDGHNGYIFKIIFKLFIYLFFLRYRYSEKCIRSS